MNNDNIPIDVFTNIPIGVVTVAPTFEAVLTTNKNGAIQSIAEKKQIGSNTNDFNEFKPDVVSAVKPINQEFIKQETIRKREDEERKRELQEKERERERQKSVEKANMNTNTNTNTPRTSGNTQTVKKPTTFRRYKSLKEFWANKSIAWENKEIKFGLLIIGIAIILLSFALLVLGCWSFILSVNIARDGAWAFISSQWLYCFIMLLGYLLITRFQIVLFPGREGFFNRDWRVWLPIFLAWAFISMVDIGNIYQTLIRFFTNMNVNLLLWVVTFSGGTPLPGIVSGIFSTAIALGAEPGIFIGWGFIKESLSIE